jgi:hypothetical protein
MLIGLIWLIIGPVTGLSKKARNLGAEENGK